MKRLPLSLLFFLYLICDTTGQKKLPFSIEFGTNPLLLAKHYANGCIQLKGKNVLHKFSICANFEYGGRRVIGTPLTQEISSRIIQAELRYFPFLYLKKEDEGCYNFKKIKKNPGQFLLSGIYIAPGFQHSKTEINLLADPQVDAPIQHFHAGILENALTIFSGLQYKIHVVSIGTAYGFSLGQPRLDDAWNLLGDRVFTSSYPVKFRFNHGLRVFIGLHF